MEKPKLLVAACHLDRPLGEIEWELFSMLRNSADVYLLTMKNLLAFDPREVIEGLLGVGTNYQVQTHRSMSWKVQNNVFIPVCDLYAGIRQQPECITQSDGGRGNGHLDLGEGGFERAKYYLKPAILLPHYDLSTLAQFAKG